MAACMLYKNEIPPTENEISPTKTEIPQTKIKYIPF
jgi:hypothetical protein